MKTSKTPKMPKITNELKEAVKVYLLAQAYVETIRPVVEAYQAEVIAAAGLHYSEEFAPEFVGVITTMNDSWMMDGREGDAFYAALDAARDAAGFVDFAPGYCPLSVAEYDVITAKRAICDESAYFTKVDADMAASHFSIFNKYVDTAIKFVLAACPSITTQSVLEKVKP